MYLRQYSIKDPMGLGVLVALLLAGKRHEIFSVSPLVRAAARLN